MATYNVALIFKNPQSDDAFLLLKQDRPPKFDDEDYDSFEDSDLWDLPSTKLEAREAVDPTGIVIEGLESASDKLDSRKFDFNSAIIKVLEKLGLEERDVESWKLSKVVEEAEFGPGFVHTLYISATLVTRDPSFSGLCRWMSVKDCLSGLLNVKPSSDRIGPLVVVGLLNDSVHLSRKIQTLLRHQEYPPGVILVPMKSRTQKPFHTTNLIVFAPENASNEYDEDRFVACGDALVVDPGCLPECHNEIFKMAVMLCNDYHICPLPWPCCKWGFGTCISNGWFLKLLGIIASLCRNLVVFVTHHHHDHVDGLSVIQKANPNATLIAHENTMHRISKDDWSLGYTSVTGGEKICIGGQELEAIYAPGHTDGHVALLHVATHSLVVGDHCVGQGSAVLDVTSGGNMTDYFQTTYRFMELAPHALIPMHGRVNMWPKNMLCGYLKNRRSRESSVLKAIENGAQTLIDIVADVYSDVDHRLWVPASSNVRLHVDHLAQQNKLPSEFSLSKFQRTCGIHFISRWMWAFAKSKIFPWNKRLGLPMILIAGTFVCFAMLYSVKNKQDAK